MEKVIELINLTKTYKNGRGIKNLNLEINKGDVFGFLGPNGAGKTTTMKILTGLLPIYQGEVRIFGHDIAKDFGLAMQKVGSIVETAEAFTYLTALENLKQHARFYPQADNNRIDEVLEITGIIKYKNEKVRNYSLGMRQRLGLASAILSKPELLILDEPLNGLDVEGMIEMRNLIKTLAETEKTTFFISSHLIHDVELTCNRIGIILAGELFGVEYTENILKNFDSLENYYVSEVEKNGNV